MFSFGHAQAKVCLLSSEGSKRVHNSPGGVLLGLLLPSSLEVQGSYTSFCGEDLAFSLPYKRSLHSALPISIDDLFVYRDI